MSSVLSVRDLSIAYKTAAGSNLVVSGVDLDVERGQVVGLAGESGCGKSTLALAVTGYRPRAMEIVSGSSNLDGVDLIGAPLGRLRQIWGRKIAFVPQNAATALHPSLKIGRQLAAPMRKHLGIPAAEAADRIVSAFEQVGIPDPREALERYPFQFSGGQQQRIAIVAALACSPDVVVLDEPTTGLDLISQGQMTTLLGELATKTGVAMLHVSHDLRLLREVADRLIIMYAGEVVESGATREVLTRPRHPYTGALRGSLLRMEGPTSVASLPGRPPLTVVTDECSLAPRCPWVTPDCKVAHIPLLTVEGDRQVRCIRTAEIGSVELEPRALPLAAPQQQNLLTIDDLTFSYGKADILKNISLELRSGESMGIVGESGSGKSSLLRVISGLQPPTAGRIAFRGKELPPRVRQRLRSTRHEIQMIFQNPGTSLNPKQSIAEIINRPLQLFQPQLDGAGRRRRVAELVEMVRLPKAVLERHPSQLSGGQQQRVAIARAFAAEPSLLLCDEITSALDVSVQAEVLELIMQLSVTSGTSVIFVSHDLSVIRAVTDTVAVLFKGEICERGATESILSHPKHPYTQRLRAGVPVDLISSGHDGG